MYSSSEACMAHQALCAHAAKHVEAMSSMCTLAAPSVGQCASWMYAYREASVWGCRYATEKAKYEETLKQEAPISPPPLASPQPAATGGLAPSAVPPSGLASPSGKGRKDTDAPKRNRTAYILFSMEFRKTLDPSISFNDGTKLVRN